MAATVAQAALWLANHVDAIAADPAAGVCYREIEQLTNDIERCINRPRLRRFLGPCPTLLTREQVKRIKRKDIDGKRQACATMLQADHDAAEVTCPTCDAVHNVDELIKLMRNHLDYEPMTSVELLGSRTSEIPGVLTQLGEPVARSTFHQWRKAGILQPRGYRSNSGTIIPARSHKTDIELFWLADVRKLRDQKPQLKPTGAAAHATPT